MADLADTIGQLNAVGDIRGRGFLIGIELVQDKETRQPFDPACNVTELIREKTLEAGLICYPVNGTIDGVHGDVAIISPPYNATDHELAHLVDLFSNGLKRTLQALGTN